MKKEILNQLSGIILDASIEVHRNLGPGLLESVYEHCLLNELNSRGLKVENQITYLKLSDKKLGLLINFNVKRVTYGFERFVNGIDD